MIQISVETKLQLPSYTQTRGYGDLFLFQIDGSISNIPKLSSDFDVPNLMSYIPYFNKPTNSFPLNMPNPTGGILDISPSINGRQVEIVYTSPSTSGELMFMIYWFGTSGNFVMPTISVSGNLTQKQSFNNNSSQYASIIDDYGLVYMTILQYSSSNIDGYINFSNNGKIPSDAQTKLYIVRLI